MKERRPEHSNKHRSKGRFQKWKDLWRFLTTRAHYRDIRPTRTQALWMGGVSALLIVLFLNCLPATYFAKPTSTVMEASNGQLLGARIAADGQWRFPALDSVPQKFKTCVIQFEDREFFDHAGVNPKATLRAMLLNLKHQRVVSGGSTITMQTIRLMRDNPSRTVDEKVLEMFMAVRLEMAASKEDILKMWASNAPFGGNVVGLDAASWRYYGRAPHTLSWSEAATLAVLPNAPGLIFPGKNQEKLKAKRNRLLKRLHEMGHLDAMQLRLAKQEPLPQKPHALPQLAPHLLDRMIGEGHEGKRIRTTIDYHIQKHTLSMVKQHHNQLQANGVHNAAAMVMDVETGNVLGYVGNTYDMEAKHDNHVDVIRAPRSTGSILKPFLYAGMLEQGYIMPDMLVPDVPVHIAGYVPKNYHPTYDGAVPASSALLRSLNVPAVLMLKKYGVSRFHHQLQRQGMTTLTYQPGHYGLSLVLGGAEARLEDLVTMYGDMGRTLKQFSRQQDAQSEPARFIVAINGVEVVDKRKEQSRPALSAGAVWSTFEALQKVARPEGESGWQNFETPGRIAWKTGTSYGFRDAWAVGTSANHVVGIWVGNADGEGRPGLVGVKAAAPLLFDVFDPLPTSEWYKKPWDDMKEVAVCRQSGHRASEICEHIDKVAVPSNCLKTTDCPYHQLVHLNAQETHRVDASCSDVTEMVHLPWFVLPTNMEWFYKSHHPEYKVLPPVHSACDVVAEAHSPIAILYPRAESRIMVPVELSGEQGSTVFEASHTRRAARLHWHLDDVYMGSTTDIHQMEMNPEKGPHVLTLVDENGNTVSCAFEVETEERPAVAEK